LPACIRTFQTSIEERRNHLRRGRAQQAGHVALYAVAEWVPTCCSFGLALLEALALPR
jgi:hypothetical protein